LHEEGAVSSIFFSMHFLVITSMVQVECMQQCVSLLGRVLVNLPCLLLVYLSLYAPSDFLKGDFSFCIVFSHSVLRSKSLPYGHSASVVAVNVMALCASFSIGMSSRVATMFSVLKFLPIFLSTVSLRCKDTRIPLCVHLDGVITLEFLLKLPFSGPPRKSCCDHRRRESL
jgi:hypothetical protein